ncbi:NAD(P)-binding protein [Punctularia strigosozonata HHB-11173 SS5]|uniref:NAD(P)-binding protein n=1 Tax=Punctularia strigosozonata (strain HHB-11173) TaxID=741275 RepID=UPI0004416363|nr:NAD(P)-binding protein [Punctularia strigosozonata HHB-11173 SS5]EIN13989.1 NAD(P)-binding protein [Punctularia strigosozonata HHB-11173 SS5]
MVQKVVLCGAGFLGSRIAETIISSSASRAVQLASRHPSASHEKLGPNQHTDRLLAPVVVDITKPDTLVSAMKDASVVVSLVGIMHGTEQDYERIQWRGAENVAKATRQVGAKLIHISAIGADPESNIPYARTKALGEQAVLEACPDATIIRPSLVFGPGDSFYQRFARLSAFLPFLPVFGGGTSRFQPVYSGDIARAVEIIARKNPATESKVAGKIIEAGGPEVFTYKEIMQQVLDYSGRRRSIVSLPFGIGIIQGAILERLPVNLFTVTRDQIKQLKFDNVTTNDTLFNEILETEGFRLSSVHEVLPTYI